MQAACRKGAAPCTFSRKGAAQCTFSWEHPGGQLRPYRYAGPSQLRPRTLHVRPSRPALFQVEQGLALSDIQPIRGAGCRVANLWPYLGPGCPVAPSAQALALKSAVPLGHPRVEKVRPTARFSQKRCSPVHVFSGKRAQPIAPFLGKRAKRIAPFRQKGRSRLRPFGPGRGYPLSPRTSASSAFNRLCASAWFSTI